MIPSCGPRYQNGKTASLCRKIYGSCQSGQRSGFWLLIRKKCKVMHIGQEFTTTYAMEDGGGLKNLEAIVKEKDLGVHVTTDLKSDEQCTQSARKAQWVLGMVKRHFKELDKDDFMVIYMYKAYIRPHLEHCVQAGTPHLVNTKTAWNKSREGQQSSSKGLRNCHTKTDWNSWEYVRWRNGDSAETWLRYTRYSTKRKEDTHRSCLTLSLLRHTHPPFWHRWYDQKFPQSHFLM